MMYDVSCVPWRCWRRNPPPEKKSARLPGGGRPGCGSPKLWARSAGMLGPAKQQTSRGVMRRPLLLAATGLSCLLAASSPVSAAGSGDTALFTRFDAAIRPDDLRDWMKLLAAEPNHVGSPHDKANAEWILAQFKSWGWDAHIESFDVLYPTPIHESLEMTAPKHFTVTLQEPPIKGDTSATAKQPALPGYFAYQGDGDVKGELVYVNYGMKDDYDALERMGVGVKGKIVIARYGHG